MTWLRKAAQDPTMRTYMREAKAMSDYTMVKQFLSETDKTWMDRVERLATAIQETGGVRPTSEKVAKKFIMNMCLSAIMVASTATYTLQNLLMKYNTKAK